MGPSLSLQLREYPPFLQHQFLGGLVVLVQFADLLGRVLPAVVFAPRQEDLRVWCHTLAKDPSPMRVVVVYSL